MLPTWLWHSVTWYGKDFVTQVVGTPGTDY
jgi:hypothetical protein